MDVVEQEALVDSYHSAREIRRDRWRYSLHRAELAAAYREFDKAADEVRGKTENKVEDIAGSADAAPRRHDHEASTSAGTASNEEE